MTFQPSQHGFRFVNRFPGLPVPFAIPGIPKTSGSFGLCGGMSAAAADFFHAGRPIPQTTTVPTADSPLYQYLYRRQVTSFGRRGLILGKFIKWMVFSRLSRAALQRRTYDEFGRLRKALDQGQVVPVGLIYVSSWDPRQVWENHQVLAYGYTGTGDGDVTLRIYDPNYPGHDEVLIQTRQKRLGWRLTFWGWLPRFRDSVGFECWQVMRGRASRPVYGFFAVPYEPEIPLG